MLSPSICLNRLCYCRHGSVILNSKKITERRGEKSWTFPIRVRSCLAPAPSLSSRRSFCPRPSGRRRLEVFWIQALIRILIWVFIHLGLFMIQLHKFRSAGGSRSECKFHQYMWKRLQKSTLWHPIWSELSYLQQNLRFFDGWESAHSSGSVVGS